MVPPGFVWYWSGIGTETGSTKHDTGVGRDPTLRRPATTVGFLMDNSLNSADRATTAQPPKV